MHSQDFLAKGAGLMASIEQTDPTIEIQGGNIPLPRLEDLQTEQQK